MSEKLKLNLFPCRKNLDLSAEDPANSLVLLGSTPNNRHPTETGVSTHPTSSK
jgi:hypothetical protein